MWFVFLGLVLMAWFRFRRSEPKPAEEPKQTPEPAETKLARPVAAVTTLTAAYAIFAVWTFFAWYRMHKPNRAYRWGGDGWMGPTTYAGGADKAGHAWATYALARLGTVMLTGWGGFTARKATLISSSLSELLFTGVEVKDGFYYEFSFSDLAGDSVGAVLAVLLDSFPRMNELFGFRVEYFPSEMYTRKVIGASPCPIGGCSRWNIAEDYSGQTYLAALHLGGIKAVRDKLGAGAKLIDIGVGFGTRNYRPLPDHDITEIPHQDLDLRLAFNAQGLCDLVLDGKARKIGRGLFEVFQLPFGSMRLLGASREGPMRYEKSASRRATTIRRRPTSGRAIRATTGFQSRLLRAPRSK
jgi:hypothetical protein